MDITRNPYEAWQKVKDIPGALRFLGGKRCEPEKSTGTKCYTIGRAPVGPDSMMPRPPAGHLEMDMGMIISAQHAPNVLNKLQKQVKEVVEKRFSNDERLSLKAYGVSYRSKMAGARHVWMAHLL
jgi:hypothetical protein